MASPQFCLSCGEKLPEGSTGCPRCLAETIDKPIIPIPLIAAYKMVRLLGKGGMGAVYLAEDNVENRAVAIKIISKELSQDTRGRNRFLREAKALATIEHPHVVRFFSVGEFADQPYIVMEYVEGETLAERIKKGSLPVKDSLRILHETVQALEAAWKKQVIHRDIKPSNILLDKQGRVKVADFGLAKPLQIGKDSTLTQSGSIIGSPHYMSPEQAQGRSTDFRSDIYALGVVLYEMLVGERPFEDTTPLAIVIKHLNTPMPSPREKRRDLPESIVRLLQWMTRKDPEKRPSSYEQLLEKIDSLLNIHEYKKPVFQKYGVFAMAAAFLLVVGIGIAILFRPPLHQTPSLSQTVTNTAPVVTQPAATAIVAINALPWARVKVSSLTKEILLPSIPEQERVTPCNFSLPEGEYSLELMNDVSSDPVQKTIKVDSSKVNSFVFTMPTYDPKKALAQIRSEK